MQRASDIEVKPPPNCPTCGQPMSYKGGTFGYVHCEWMLLYKKGGWERNGQILKDRRLEDRQVE